MPNLTYMLTFTDKAELEAKWDLFRNDPRLEEALHQPALSPSTRSWTTSAT